MRHIPLILLAAALCAGEGPPPKEGQHGPPRGPSPEELFAKADADQDGRITLAELTAAMQARKQAGREARFAKIDANGDGQISKEEFLAYEPEPPPGDKGRKGRSGPDPEEMFKRHDRNGDGAITADEMQRPEHDRGEGKGKGEGKGRGKDENRQPMAEDLLGP